MPLLHSCLCVYVSVCLLIIFVISPPLVFIYSDISQNLSAFNFSPLLFCFLSLTPFLKSIIFLFLLV